MADNRKLVAQGTVLTSSVMHTRTGILPGEMRKTPKRALTALHCVICCDFQSPIVFSR